MHKSQRNTGTNAVFYKPVDGQLEVRSGYLYKSPPANHLRKERSWKKRFFVLFKVNDNLHLLKYFKSEQEKDRPIGGIDLASVSFMYVSPEHHQRWGWIQKSFRCSPSCVLYIRAADRDYFLVGESSEEVDGWFSDLFEALKKRPHKLLSSEEVYNGQQIIEVITRPSTQRKNSTAVYEKSPPKIRSKSAPSPNSLQQITERCEGEDTKRPTSEPIYDYPSSYLRVIQNEETDATRGKKSESLKPEVEAVSNGTLMRTINLEFDKWKIQDLQKPSGEETGAGDREEANPLDSSSSSDTGAISPVEGQERSLTLENQSSTESLEHIPPEERDIEVNQADLKKHLTLIDVDGKATVSAWTGQPHTVCLFHKGDRIVGLNDLHITNVKEFNTYISKSLKNEVKLTILRRPGCVPLHSPNHLCSDVQEERTDR
ncbi:pleckstrin homology domain-containing family S member 1 isoform X2 [Cynoglossus semilaevis]|uniref:pleckstrin homology domain-containing family S member 1 isoform X2 n=1 Tax=Cynoglossus semilaevis TaxID=244447 RepID=UPI0007DC88BD|nr:pleckstrin homology domain-containing family S member 1 isoform X2 [Cynoglossus semilaevis]